MNNFFASLRASLLFMSGRLAVGMVVSMLGLPFVTAQATTVSKVPLVTQVAQDPNVVLMLDDSSTMGYDYMPNLAYMSDTTNKLAMNDASVNYLYYDPTVTYTPPVKADGTSYPDYSLTDTVEDGFTPTTSVDLTAYDGSNDTGQVTYSSYKKASYSATLGSLADCQTASDAYIGVHNLVYDTAQSLCTFDYNGAGNAYFQYVTGPSGGSYTTYYVADSSSGCPSNTSSNCYLSNDTTGKAAPVGIAAGTNIGNWFAYYHTRMLLQKSGLMNALSTISTGYRIGYGSTNGSNDSNLGPASNIITKNSTHKIAQAVAFDKSPDSSSKTQREYFWTWLAGLQPSSASTKKPLRSALDSVGQYYSGAQPWEDDSGNELSCRQSYTVLSTDALWNDNTFAGPGNIDGTSATSSINGPEGQSYTYSAVQPYSDSVEDTLADVAMKYWSTDLRTGVSNEVPSSDVDPAFWQHMTTFTLAFGYSPLYSDGTTVIPSNDVFKWANGGAAISGFSWPDPTSVAINKVADVLHAAVDGHGGFNSVTTPHSVELGFDNVISSASDRIGTGASLAANSTELKTGTVAYQANYYTNSWKGDLKAYSVDANTGAIAVDPTWSAANKLPTYKDRNIYTLGTGGTSLYKFTGTSDSGSLPTAEATLLKAEATTLGSTTQDLINYLRGDSSLELGGTATSPVFRQRDTPLGDIVDSQPVYVGAPIANEFYGQTFSGSSTYAAFATTEFSRNPAVYVAANDGMLHSFDASTGVENFAYLPGGVINAGVAELADPGYGSTLSHEFFNDGQLTVADACVKNCTSTTGDWKTVLVGTTGRGTAMTVYALDITDPAAPVLLWEKSASTDTSKPESYIGQMVGKPVIAQTSDGTWSVLIGNGYNSAQDKAALLEFNLGTGELVAMTTNSDSSNGLAAPVAWMNDPSTGVSTQAYAGDLYGHVWKFDLTNTPTGGTIDKSDSSLLFTATHDTYDSSGTLVKSTPQPITGGMLAGMDPATNNVWLFFGTGEYLNKNDLSDVSAQAWYGIIVQQGSNNKMLSLSSGPSSLKQRYILAESAGNTSANPPVLPARGITPYDTVVADGDSSTKNVSYAGWYMNLQTPTKTTAQGERIVTPNQFQGSMLLATTRIPGVTGDCNPSGSGWIMAVDPWTGTGPQTGGFFDTNGDGSIDSNDNVKDASGNSYVASGVGFSSLPNNPIFVGGNMLLSFDNGTRGSLQTAGSTGATGRVSWRELTTQ